MQGKEMLPVVGRGRVVRAVSGSAMESWWMVSCVISVGKMR
jgi:hypothetical protein